MTMCLWKERLPLHKPQWQKYQVKISRDSSCLPISILTIHGWTAVPVNSTVYNGVSFNSQMFTSWPIYLKKDQVIHGIDFLKNLFSCRLITEIRKEIPPHLRNKQCFLCIFQEYLSTKECVFIGRHTIFCVLFQLFLLWQEGQVFPNSTWVFVFHY